jgi:hypothetical protein
MYPVKCDMCWLTQDMKRRLFWLVSATTLNTVGACKSMSIVRRTDSKDGWQILKYDITLGLAIFCLLHALRIVCSVRSERKSDGSSFFIGYYIAIVGLGFTYLSFNILRVFFLLRLEEDHVRPCDHFELWWWWSLPDPIPGIVTMVGECSSLFLTVRSVACGLSFSYSPNIYFRI